VDFYTVPVPSLLAMPGALRNNVVNVQDAQAVFSYFKATAVAGSLVYEQDLNNNGVRDGWEYDRSVDAFGNLGPPDGVVSPREAQAAFAQFAANVRCTSGFKPREAVVYDECCGPPTLGVGVTVTSSAFPGVLGDGCVDTEETNAKRPLWTDVQRSCAGVAGQSQLTSRQDRVVVQGRPGDLRVLPWWAQSAGPRRYEQDLNQNGVRDGWEYDRSINQFGAAESPGRRDLGRGGPGGVRAVHQRASCTSGYNMKN